MIQRPHYRIALTLAAVASVVVGGLTMLPSASASAVSVKDKCTIVGTKGDDVLRGTPGDDVICGRGGDDVITALGGDDVIYAGSGKDDVDGGTGRDTIYGVDAIPARFVGSSFTFQGFKPSPDEVRGVVSTGDPDCVQIGTRLFPVPLSGNPPHGQVPKIFSVTGGPQCEPGDQDAVITLEVGGSSEGVTIRIALRVVFAKDAALVFATCTRGARCADSTPVVRGDAQLDLTLVAR